LHRAIEANATYASPPAIYPNHYTIFGSICELIIMEQFVVMLTIALINKKKSPSELLDQSVRIIKRPLYDMI
jgi:hypothetical protein